MKAAVIFVVCAVAVGTIYSQTLYEVAGCFLGPKCYNCSAPVCGEVYKSGLPMGNYCFGNSWCLDTFNNTCGKFGSSYVYKIDMSGCQSPGGNATCTIMENLPKCPT